MRLDEWMLDSAPDKSQPSAGASGGLRKRGAALAQQSNSWRSSPETSPTLSTPLLAPRNGAADVDESTGQLPSAKLPGSSSRPDGLKPIKRTLSSTDPFIGLH